MSSGACDHSAACVESLGAMRAHEPHVLFGVLVAARHVNIAAAAEVLAGPAVHGGDDVPGRAAAREHVERREATGECVGLVVSRVLCCDETDAVGDGGEGCEVGLRVGAARDVDFDDLAEVLAQAQALAEEERVKEAALGGLDGLAERLEVDLVEGRGRLPVDALVDAGVEHAEVDVGVRAWVVGRGGHDSGPFSSWCGLRVGGRRGGEDIGGAL
jgi:hypothetical protein